MPTPVVLVLETEVITAPGVGISNSTAESVVSDSEAMSIVSSGDSEASVIVSGD